jgi:hypothetical protein
MSCMERISAAVTWPGDERGQLERSSSTHSVCLFVRA